MVSEFQKGDIILHNFNSSDTHVIRGQHMSVVLHSSEMPNNTVTICPISSLYDKQGNEKHIEPYHLVLKSSDYPCLNIDSFVKTDQIITVDRVRITDVRRPSSLTPIELIGLDLKIITLYEMATSITDLVDNKVIAEIVNVLKDIDEELKEEIKRNLKDLVKDINKEIIPLIRELSPGNQKLVLTTILKIDIEVITKVNAIVDEVLREIKKRYMSKYGHH